jgi:hypothetical protein
MTKNNINPKLLNSVAEMIAFHTTGSTVADILTVSPSFLVLQSDIYGWGDGESPIIQWEEGPYNWALEFEGSGIQEVLRDAGWFCEAVTSWALGFYRL